jgi:threonine/homoserine/homoserine lactone efflux protein
MRCSIALVVALLLFAPAVARAQPSHDPSRHSPAWIAVGAGAGFGLGMWTGLTAFDDSINSDRKVWATAIVSAAGGGLIAYLLTREKRSTGRQGRRARKVHPCPRSTRP